MSLHREVVEPEVVRLRARSWRGQLAGYEVSAYVVRGVMIDTGPPHARAEVLRAVRELAPRGVVITHSHEDHAGNAAELAAMSVPLFMDPSCERELRDPGPIGMYRRLVWGLPNPLAAPVDAFDPAPLSVLPLPGHTDEHLALWDAERRILVGGDLFLGVKVRVAHHGESPRRLLESLRAAAALEPRLLLDAHRGAVRDPVPLLRAKVSWMEETIGEITRLAAHGLAEREITRRVLGREELVGVVSRGEYSKREYVRAVLKDR